MQGHLHIQYTVTGVKRSSSHLIVDFFVTQCKILQNKIFFIVPDKYFYIQIHFSVINQATANVNYETGLHQTSKQKYKNIREL